MSFLLFLLTVSSTPVEARDYHIRASDGEVYTVTLGENPNVLNFTIKDANGDILRGVTEDERVVATELYFAAKFFWNILPLYSPDTPFKDWEASIEGISKKAIGKLVVKQGLDILTNGLVNGFSGAAQKILSGGDIASIMVGWLPGALSNAIGDELEHRILIDAAVIAKGAARRAVEHENVLRAFWLAYETRSAVVSMDEVNAAWENYYKWNAYLSLTADLVDRYLKDPESEISFGTGGLDEVAGGLVPSAQPVIKVLQVVDTVLLVLETIDTIHYDSEHIQQLRNINETAVSRIHQQAFTLIAAGKRQSRAKLEEQSFFQPRVVLPLEDIRISIDDDPQRLDVRDYFSPNGNNLTYVPRSSDLSIAVSRTERTGSSVIIIIPKGVGTASITVHLMNFRGLSVTESFTVRVGEDTQQVQRPEPDGTIDHQLLLIDGPPLTLDVTEYFSWDNALDYEVASDPSGIVAASISGSRVTLTPRQLGNASVVVTAYDRNDRSLSTIQTIPVLVYTDRATIVRPPSSTTFRPPTTSNPSAKGLARGVSVIVQNTLGLGLNIRHNPRVSNNNPDNRIGRVHDGATGRITDGPRQNDGFTWWKIDWDLENKEGWSADFVRGDQIVFRRPTDLEIRDFDVSDDTVKPGEDFRLEVEIRNNGPDDSEPTEIYFYYRLSGEENDVRVAGKGKVDVPSIGEGGHRDVSLRVPAPMTPHTDYDYGAILPPDIPEGYDANLVDPRGQIRLNNVAEEVRVAVTSAPHLIIASISPNRSILDPGERFTLETTIRNQGVGAPARNVTLGYYRSSNPNISTRDAKVGNDSVSSDALGTNETSPPESINLIAPTEPGIYYYGVCILSDNNRSQCSGAVAITVREIGTAALSDLVVGPATLSRNTIGPGESFTLETTVRNQGVGTASSTTLRGYQSSNSSISTSDTEVGSMNVSPLSSGATAIQQLRLTAPLGSGTYYYGVSIDSVRNESNTANNRSASVALTVENRPPVVSKTLPPQALVVGDATAVDVVTYFSDPNEDILTYYVFSDAASVVVAELSDLSNSELVLTPLAVGNTTITVEVSDGELTATQTIDVSVTVPGVSEETWMPDTNLRAAVRNALGLVAAEVLTQEAIQGLIFLEASVPLDAAPSEKIRDLTGLEHAMQLAVLSLRHNEVVDVSVLSGLTQLILLDIRGNEVIDVSPLSDLTHLTELSLDGNPITDLAPLRRLTAENPDVKIDIDINAVTTPVSEETWMPDANLRAAVRNALGLAPGDTLTREAMQGLTDLDASVEWDAPDAVKISDLMGLEHATQLRKLDFYNNEIVDVSDLSELTQLRELYLGGNEIVDVSDLSELTQLTTLDLYNNEIVDVSDLSELTQLTSLYLGDNKIVDVSPLSGLRQLRWLDLHNNEIVDISDLSELTQLRWLSLYNNKIVDVSPLSGLTQLRELYLGGNEIVDVSDLSELTQLPVLSLRHNGVIDISALSELTQLTWLYLGGNEIVDVSDLSGLTQLTRLTLTENKISDVSAFEGLINLQRLTLKGNPILDFAPLRRLKSKNPRIYIDIDINAVTTPVSEETWMPDANLRARVREALNLADDAVLTKQAMQNLTKLGTQGVFLVPISKRISNLMGLEQATQLTELYLGWNEISDISPLLDLNQLTTLSLRDNEISDISPLSGMTQLMKLHLGGNEISDASPLSGLTQLTELYLRDNQISEVSSLEGLVKLDSLYLKENPIADLAPLRRLKAKNPDLSIDIDISVETPVISGGGAAFHVYWTLFDRGEIQRSNLDGTSVRTLFTRLTHPMDIAVDIAGGKIYWSTFSSDKNKIQRANLDGTNIQDIVTNELLGPAGIHPLLNPVDWIYIALDVAGGKIYWTNDDGDKIQRANLDGSNVEDIVTEGLSSLNGIALDVRRKKIYWTNLNKIQRANLDGSNVQDIFVNSRHYILYGIALDVAGGKVYWGNLFERKIQRANLDGSNVQDIVTGVETDNVALDVAGGKIYWTNNDGDKIQRANLDGSNVEDIVTGVKGHGIALGTFLQDPPPVVREDVNRDGVIDLQDTTVVRANLGQTGQNDADVNGDDVVDVDDLVLVLAAIENAAAAPTARTQIQQLFAIKEVQQWLTEAQLSADTSPAYLSGITMLEQILALLIPQETALFVNYPNPFNPETWIPYQLAKPADITLSIYSVDGKLVRMLALGHQAAGVYHSKNQAAYWDGRNTLGESVASGVYFYTLTAGDFSATKRLLIVK